MQVEEQKGKLQRRMEEKLGNSMFAASDLHKVLDEAKQEYPTYEDAKAELTKRIGHEWVGGLGEASVHLILTELRNDWLKKWFSSE